MTNDEAWEMQAKALHGNGALRRDCFEAGWDAALADTLGLLEMLAKEGSDPVWRGLQVNYCPDCGFTYFKPVSHNPNMVAMPRAEAEALLGEGKEKKE